MDYGDPDSIQHIAVMVVSMCRCFDISVFSLGLSNFLCEKAKRQKVQV